MKKTKKPNLQSKTTFVQNNEKEHSATLTQNENSEQDNSKEIDKPPATKHNKLLTISQESNEDVNSGTKEMDLYENKTQGFHNETITNENIAVHLEKDKISDNVIVKKENNSVTDTSEKSNSEIVNKCSTSYSVKEIDNESDEDKSMENKGNFKMLEENQTYQKTVQLASQSHLAQENDITSNNIIPKSSPVIDTPVNYQKIETENHNKMSNIAMIVYVLVFVAVLLYTVSMKIQLDKTQLTMEEMNMKLRAINDDKITLQDKLHETQTQMYDNTYNDQIIKMTSDTKEINDPIALISSLQSWIDYIISIPKYFLLSIFSFQTTYLNLFCSVLFKDRFSPMLLKIPILKERSNNPRLSKLLYFLFCILGYPVSCEIIGFVGWMTGFSISQKTMLNVTKRNGLMLRYGSDIVSDWTVKDNALQLWLISIFTGGIITFISYKWYWYGYEMLNKRTRTARDKKIHNVFFMTCTLFLLNQFFYMIFAWFTDVTIGPITFINWFGARKSVSSLLSLVIYATLTLFTLKFFHVNAFNLVTNVFQFIQKQLFNIILKSEK